MGNEKGALQMSRHGCHHQPPQQVKHIIYRALRMELILPQPLNLVLRDSCPSLYQSFERTDVQPVTAAQTAIPPTPAGAQRPKPHHGGDKQKAGEVLLLLHAQSKQQSQSSRPCFQSAQPLWTGHLSALKPAVPSDSPSNLH